MVGPLKSVLMKRPEESYGSQSEIAHQWKDLNYSGPPSLSKAVADYDRFLELITESGTSVQFLPNSEDTGLDSIYTHDPVVVTNAGIILCNMGKGARKSEPEAMKEYFHQHDLPILGRITPPGTLEGGDILWIDERTVAVGEGYRSNGEGIQQFHELLGDSVDKVISVPLTHWRGPSDCLHLLSNVSPIDVDLYVVYSPLLTVPFRNLLLDRGIRLIEVPDEEYSTLGCNILAVAPRKVIMVDGNPTVKRRLEAESVEIKVFDGSEICLRGAGGPTCLTRPLYRE
tara:strand:- start:8018 stop:8872 length:855 start_codon:yes stop_codon:yes gene_type:complete